MLSVSRVKQGRNVLKRVSLSLKWSAIARKGNSPIIKDIVRNKHYDVFCADHQRLYISSYCPLFIFNLFNHSTTFSVISCPASFTTQCPMPSKTSSCIIGIKCLWSCNCAGDDVKSSEPQI